MLLAIEVVTDWLCLEWYKRKGRCPRTLGNSGPHFRSPQRRVAFETKYTPYVCEVKRRPGDGWRGFSSSAEAGVRIGYERMSWGTKLILQRNDAFGAEANQSNDETGVDVGENCANVDDGVGENGADVGERVLTLIRGDPRASAQRISLRVGMGKR